MELIATIVVELLGGVAIIASVRRGLRDLEKRVDAHEDFISLLPKDYVPRTEIDRALSSIEATAKRTHALVENMAYGRRRFSIEAAGDSQNFEQITIYGRDGHSGLMRWETSIEFMYLDSREINGQPAPLVTVGIGCAIGLDEALSLPFQIQGSPATQQEIQRDFARVKAAPFGYLAGYYERYSLCRLSAADAELLVRKRFDVFIAALRKMFPSFDSFPETAKAGCLDLIYGLGVTGLSAPHYPSFHKAVEHQDWVTAAAECGSDTNNHAYAARNFARSQLFLEAAGL